MMKRLVLASSNPGKLREFEALLAPLGMEIVAQASLGVTETEEPHGTFVENALAKARHASRRTKLAALADDSGICVESLGGEPGVHSARFAGEPRSDARNNEKLVQLLADKDDRRCATRRIRSRSSPRAVGRGRSWRSRAGQAGSDTTRIFSCGISARPPPSSIQSRRIFSATAARPCGGCWRS